MADTQSSNAASEEYIATGVESVSEQTTSPAVSFVSEVEADQRQSTLQIDAENAATFAAQTLASNEVIAKRLSARDKSADIWLKWVYGIATLLILIGWEVFVICFSMKQLEPCECKVHHASDGVLIALWTSATANIVALPAIILNYLFPKRH